MNFVDVILPLPLEGTFTYSLPPDMKRQVAVGVRVLVPLGKSKRYIGIVDAVHDRRPEFASKPVIEILDKARCFFPSNFGFGTG